MKTALWLASWYPSKIAPFDGDFIQRHARATALVQPVHVVHVVKDAQGLVCPRMLVEESRQGGLRETIIYYKPPATGWKQLDQLISFLTYYRVGRRYLKSHIKKEGKPLIVHLHVVMRAGPFALWLKKKWGVPYAITEHWTGYQPQAGESFFQKNFLFRRMTRKVLKGASRLLPVSKHLGDTIQTIQTVPYTVVYNAADTSLFYYTDDQAPLFRFIHVSSMNYQKNIPGILRVFKNMLAYADWECIMIGPADDELKRYSEELGLFQKIKWRGELLYSEVAAEVRRASVCILFSRYENLPCVLIEAACCGVPVVAPRMGGIPEMVLPGIGQLVEPGREEALLQAMHSMMENYDQYNRKEISEWATGLFNYKKIGQEIADIYKSILAL